MWSLFVLVLAAVPTYVAKDIPTRSNKAQYTDRLSVSDLREEVREMFYHAYTSYMKYAMPEDELQPLSCSGDSSFYGWVIYWWVRSCYGWVIHGWVSSFCERVSSFHGRVSATLIF